MRRANGAGSISKLSGNRRNPWRARITIGWDDTGKQLYKNIGYFPTKAEAEIAISLDAVMPASENANITLGDLFEQWKLTRAYTDISKNTRDNYDSAFKIYMSEYHKRKFRDLRLIHFQKMIDKADALNRSKSTMQKIRTLSVILSNYAITQDITMKSYAQHVRIPKIEKKRIETFSTIEIKKLFDNDTVPLVDTILILIYTGMRISELLTLTKFNVDLDEMLIVSGNKTEAGRNRIIPIHKRIQKYVVARYNQSQTYIIEHDKSNGERLPYLPHHYRELYYETLAALGIRRLTPHKARHTFFTMLSAKCTDRKARTLIGGHTDVNFTDNTYVQPDIERLRRAINTLK